MHHKLSEAVSGRVESAIRPRDRNADNAHIRQAGRGHPASHTRELKLTGGIVFVLYAKHSVAFAR